jgi:hypothetical protein
MHESTIRQRRLRTKRRQDGWEQYELWLPPRTAGRLADHRRVGESLHQLIDRLLDAVEHQGMAGLSYHERKEAMAARVRAMHAEGLSQRKIATQLNAEGVPTPTGQGRWHHTAIAELLAQE